MIADFFQVVLPDSGWYQQGIIMVAKKCDPVAWIVGTLSGFLSRVLGEPGEAVSIWNLRLAILTSDSSPSSFGSR